MSALLVEKYITLDVKQDNSNISEASKVKKAFEVALLSEVKTNVMNFYSADGNPEKAKQIAMKLTDF